MQPTKPGAITGVSHPLSNWVTVDGRALAINPKGQVVGDSTAPNAPAWRWMPNAPNATAGSFSPMGLGAGSCHAFAINGSGTAVGRWDTPGGGTRACAFWPNASDLNDWILWSSGWVLEDAVDINDSGWIAGNGTLAGAKRSFLLRRTLWKPLELSFLRYVVQILVGLRPGGGGVVVPPGHGPDPVPPWVDRVWRSASKSKREALRALAMTDALRLLNDKRAHARFVELVPRLADAASGPGGSRKRRE